MCTVHNRAYWLNDWILECDDINFFCLDVCVCYKYSLSTYGCRYNQDERLMTHGSSITLSKTQEKANAYEKLSGNAVTCK